MKVEKMPLIVKHMLWLKLAWQWRYLTNNTGFLFIGTHFIALCLTTFCVLEYVTEKNYCLMRAEVKLSYKYSNLSPKLTPNYFRSGRSEELCLKPKQLFKDTSLFDNEIMNKIISSTLVLAVGAWIKFHSLSKYDVFLQTSQSIDRNKALL